MKRFVLRYCNHQRRIYHKFLPIFNNYEPNESIDVLNYGLEQQNFEAVSNQWLSKSLFLNEIDPPLVLKSLSFFASYNQIAYVHHVLDYMNNKDIELDHHRLSSLIRLYLFLNDQEEINLLFKKYKHLLNEQVMTDALRNLTRQSKAFDHIDEVCTKAVQMCLENDIIFNVEFILELVHKYHSPAWGVDLIKKIISNKYVSVIKTCSNENWMQLIRYTFNRQHSGQTILDLCKLREDLVPSSSSIEHQKLYKTIALIELNKLDEAKQILHIKKHGSVLYNAILTMLKKDIENRTVIEYFLHVINLK